jgi:hypothetical protein
MTATAEPAFVAATLAWCNEIRAGKGMEPLERLPKGARKNPMSCPCGAATGLYVKSYRYGDDHLGALPLPNAVIEFVAAFDLGVLPQYDASASEC